MESLRRSSRLPLLILIASLLVGPAIFVNPAPSHASYLSRMGYYVYYDDESWESLQREIDHLDIVAPYFFHLTPNGSIKELDEREDEVTAFVKSHNKKIVPIIQNEAKWDAFKEFHGDPETQEDIANDLVDLVRDRGFDGLQIDFEAINADDQQLLTEFMERISHAFRANDLIISQAVVARVSDRPSTWGGAYDYGALARLNDFVTIMAYDYTSTGSTIPGPVAPYWWVTDVLDYATKHISGNQIYLGVPFYGRDWNVDDGPPATSVSHTQAMDRAAVDDAVVGFSPEDRSPWIRYTDEDGDEHEVWYENSLSLDAKLQLALEYDLGGFSAWRIGHEDPDNWRVIGNLETPATRVSEDQASENALYFDETGHTLEGDFLRYWQDNGGLERFGFPRTEPFVEFDPMVQRSYQVQYFERARLELHPEFEGTEYHILLGHIGRWALEKRGFDPWETSIESSDRERYFPESGHSLDGEFLTYWENQGGLTRFGYPLTEEIVELSEEDGGVYTVQYFERARMELHVRPESGEPIVLLGLLGNEMLRDRGWIR